MLSPRNLNQYSKEKGIHKSVEMYKLYGAILKPIFENINYYISKKNPHYKEVYDKTKIYLDKLSNDYQLNADKYFPILSKAIIVENYKLGKYFFPDLKLLIKNNFLLGETPLKYFDIEFLSSKDNNIEHSHQNLKIIDMMIDSLTNADSIFGDEDIWFMLIECINEIINNKNIINNLLGETFKKIYCFYFRMHQKFENQKEKKIIIHNNLFFFIKNSFNELNLFMNFSLPELIVENENENKEIEKKDSDKIEVISYQSLFKIYEKLEEPDFIQNSKLKNYNPLDLLVCRTVKNIVDTICYRAAKGELSKNIIPLIPKKESDFSRNVFRLIEPPSIYNESLFSSGFFGWCYICRKTANHYCITFRLPLCSFICKNYISLEEKQLLEMNPHFVKDCPEMLKYFSSILSNKILKNKSEIISQKIYALEIISYILNNYGKYIYNQNRFIKVVKEYLIEALFKACLSNEVEIYTSSIRLFFEIWIFFKENLKREINYFIENVFLKILNSNASSFLIKKVILENFSKRNYIFFIELYANYDCELTEKFTVKNLITAFNNIIKKRYSKNPLNHSNQEYNELINIILKTMVSIVQSIFEISQIAYPPLKNSLNNEINFSRLSFGENNSSSINPENPFNYTQIPTEANNEIESNLKKKYELQSAATKFNMKIKVGLEYLKSIGYINDKDIDSEAKDISSFFRNTPNLKKENIGEFLGENTDLSIKTLKYFTESFDFKNIDIVQALRLFLSTFLLPAEGQKIDRIIEHFASEYYNDNPTLFANADSAYYLFYGIMILQTELHNPNVKDRMTLEGFKKLLEGQNIEVNLDGEYLTDIYNQILEEPLSLPEIEEEKEKQEKEKNDLGYSRIKQRLINEFNYNSKIKKNNNTIYIKLKESDIPDYLSQFMASIITPLHTIFNTVVEESDDPLLYNQAILGISYSIKILGLLNLEQQKKIIFSNLCSLTNLLQVKIIKDKNLLCIKELLSIANSDYRYCKGSYSYILEIINKLYYYLSLISMPKEERETFFKTKKQKAAETNNKKTISLVEENILSEKEIMKILSKEIYLNDFEKIFLKTLNFDSATLLEFVNSICDIARYEFGNNGLGKIFFLQKIVEISELNLFSRPRFNWNNIWKILSEFFVDIGCSTDSENSANAMDSLRQLAMKFLQKKEGENYHFQKDFLLPFLDTWKKCQSTLTQEYIIICINNLLNNYTQNIKSGWEVILTIFTEVSKMNNAQNIQNQIISVLSNISENNYNVIKDIFKDFTSCLISFIPFYQEQIIKIIDNFSNQVEEENNYKILLQCYIPFILENNEKIRNDGINNLFESIYKKLKNPKSNLYFIGKKEEFWEFILIELLINISEKLISKIKMLSISNNNLNYNSTFYSNYSNNKEMTNNSELTSNNTTSVNIDFNNEEKEKFSSTLQKLLIKIGGLFNNFFSYNYKFLGKYFDVLDKLVFYEEEKVQSASLECIKALNESEKLKTMSFLKPFLIFLTKLADKSLEKDFLSIDVHILKYDPSQYNNIIDMNIFYCYLHLNILSLLDKLIEKYIDILGEDDLNKLLNCLENSFDISTKFNNQIELRLLITDNLNLKPPKNIVALFKQMQISIKNYFFILEHLFNDNNSFQSKQNYYKRIIESSIKILNNFAESNKDYYDINIKPLNKFRNEREIKEKEKIIKYYIFPISNYIFPIIQKIIFFKFDKYKELMTNCLLEMIICEDEEIRKKVKDLLSAIYNKLTINK